MKRQHGLYLYEGQKHIFIRQLQDNYRIYVDMILPSLSGNVGENAEGSYGQCIAEKYGTFFLDINEFCTGDSDFACDEEIKTYYYYRLVQLQNYRLLAMWICCTCQLWEQQILQLLHLEATNKDLLEQEKDPEDWASTECILGKYGIEIGDKIKELRLLVNVLKHSSGRSEKMLRRIRPDFFGNNECDKIELYHTVLGDVVLNIHNKDLENYTKALIHFWKIIPTNRWLLLKKDKL